MIFFSPCTLTDKSRAVTHWPVLQQLNCENASSFSCAVIFHTISMQTFRPALLSSPYTHKSSMLKGVRGPALVQCLFTVLCALFCVESSKVPLADFPKTTWLSVFGSYFFFSPGGSSGIIHILRSSAFIFQTSFISR